VPWFWRALQDITFVVCEESDLPAESTSSLPLGYASLRILVQVALRLVSAHMDPCGVRSNSRNLEGCRIGFDLGGSDRKCAALINGKVVFSEEVRWDPYFCDDPQYHYDGISKPAYALAAGSATTQFVSCGRFELMCACRQCTR
jgi:hypothetical protein